MGYWPSLQLLQALYSGQIPSSLKYPSGLFICYRLHAIFVRLHVRVGSCACGSVVAPFSHANFSLTHSPLFSF